MQIDTAWAIAFPLHVYACDRKFGWFAPALNAARMFDVVGVPLIVLSCFWTLITVAKPASEIESIAVFAAAYFCIAAENT